MQLNWIYKKFDDLAPAELYAIMRLRNEVFVIEQNCIYQDADDKDQHSWHLAGWEGENLLAYARIIPPGVSYDVPGIGRVVTSPKCRKTGIGKMLMKAAISKAFDQFNCTEIKIGAQVYLTRFYESLGFRRAGSPYLEDGIPHIKMVLAK